MHKMTSEERYDRQLRIWGNDGQRSLTSAHICVIGASALGTEVVKNLVLPGIGSFTVIDDKIVSDSDCKKNFFVLEKDIGHPLAECVCHHLSELNPEVNAHFVVSDVGLLMDEQLEFFSSFSLVVATNVPLRSLLRLDRILSSNSIPLIVCRCCGLVGSVRLACALPHYSILSSESVDLRVDCPFPDLVSFVLEQDLDSMDDEFHAHTPWIVILILAMNEWMKTHMNSPQIEDEKSEFRKLLDNYNRDGCELNIEEAKRFAFRAYTDTVVPPEVVEVLDHELARDNSLCSNTIDFWIVVNAIKSFVKNEGNGKLPVSGTVPDMIADTDRFVTLQKIYHKKSQMDIDCIMSYVNTKLSSLHDLNGRSISREFVENICKKSRNLRVTDFRTLHLEYDIDTAKSSDIVEAVRQVEEGHNGVFYVVLRAVEAFRDKFDRYPGDSDSTDQYDEDIVGLKSCTVELLNDLSIRTLVEIPDELVEEICRYGGGELHNIAAIVGAVASQEVIKLLTHQLLPISNTWIYNGISGGADTISL